MAAMNWSHVGLSGTRGASPIRLVEQLRGFIVAWAVKDAVIRAHGWRGDHACEFAQSASRLEEPAESLSSAKADRH